MPAAFPSPSMAPSRVPGGAINPPRRVLSDYDGATTFVEFTAAPGKDVLITFKAEKPSDIVVLNGLLLDGIDPAKQIAKPEPANNDEHTAEKPTLSWRPSKSAISHDVYLGTSLDAVANATHASPEF